MPNRFARFLIVLPCAALACCIASQVAADVTTGIVGHWKLNETSGTAASDSSGNANNGTYTGGPTLGVTATCNLGVNFPADGQYVIAPASATLNAVGVSNANFSVAFWVKPNGTTGGWRPLLHKGTTDSERGPGLWLNPGDNRVHFRVSTTANWNEGSDSVANLPTGSWSHIACVKEGNKWRCYINGVLDTEFTLSASTIGDSGPLYLGDDPWYPGSNTQLDDVRIYNRALIATDVDELCSPRLHWKLNETSGTTAADSSTCENTGTVTGTAAWIAARRGNGFDFNGSTKIDVTSTCGTPANFTLAGWVRVDALDTSGGEIISIGDYAVLRVTATTLQSRIYIGSSTYRSVTFNTALVGAGWRHVAATFDDSANSFKLYVDGALVATATETSSVMWSDLGTKTVVAAHGNGSTAYDLDGAIDDVRVYGKALTLAEVAEIYGLVGHWKLDEASGTMAVDSSGIGNNGTHTNGPVVAQTGVRSLAVQFDGSNDYSTAGSGASLRVTESVSMSAWVNPTPSTNATRMIVNKEGEYELALTSTGVVQWALANTTPGWAWHTTTSTVPDNKWSHIVVTYSQGTAKTYVDGVLKETYSGAGNIGDAHASLNELRIAGRSNNPANQYLGGLVDDVRVYNRAILADEIAELYGLIGHWKFDEAAGTTAVDSSGRGNNGTINGALWTSDCAGNTALEFDGLNDRATTNSNFQPPATGAVAFWMRGSGTPAVQQRLFGINGDWEARIAPTGIISFDLGASPYVGNEPFASTVVDELDRWYHVVAIFNDSTDAYSVYVNGELTASGTSPVNLIARSAGILSFGTRTGSTEYWRGALRDFRIYNRAILTSEIASLSGMIARWQLNESSGTIATDSSAAGNNANYVGSPTLGVSSSNSTTNGTAVELNGTSQYLSTGKSLLNGLTKFSLAAWVRPDDLTPDKSFLGQNGLIELGIDTATDQIDLWTSSGGSLSASAQLAASKWSHVVAVGDGLSLRIYVNGVEVGSGGTVAASYGSNTGTFKIGEGVLSSSGTYFDGRFDDVRVYSRALCPEEINAIYQGGRPVGVRIIRWVETR